MTFTAEELDYLNSQPLARIATVGADGQPDVVPVGFEYDGAYFYVGGGLNPERTRKVVNVWNGRRQVALVIDDLPSTDPWSPRFLRVYGTAEVVERGGQFGAGTYLRITPTVSWSWHLDGRPVDADAFAPRRTEHTAA
ncbi:pyridoxamine 5'-phosphate oxidase-related FMN- binding protein [Kribbella flavida DSM 17836]|uniref:Pyridoxamine 5'-phosphate oxidase-related FMN-binding protein n=1 Tax=Kribbella flavida (strain DSM 17836 / JCM 10339 / NBRC 14399) TaxID=479435 RepID=D2PQH5_KRIFD|nr:PPOX class F420-dependent oxidoreductase [Kribbella flavida]ADB29162.1 pyridoxamine 5'-phosphate oxidase-related FMN- binding protein [Kribbella flavida DSM 17836]